MSKGPIYVGKNTTLAQLADSTGKNKTQQTIIIEHVIGRLTELLELHRARDKREEKIEERIASIIASRLYQDDEELDEAMNAYKRSRPERLKEMEQAVAVAAALPTIFEGNVGAIENEIQPSAPLMRMYDGTNMKDALYQQVQMDRSTGIAQSRNPPTSGNIFANANATQDMATAVNQINTTMPLRSAATSQDAIVARQRLNKTVGDYFMETMPDMSPDTTENMMTELFEDAGEMLDMREIVMTALMRNMSENNGETPSKVSMEGLFEMMDPYDLENLIVVGRQIRTLSMSQDPSYIVTFFDEDVL
ncbi:hypothetical protein TI39_contig356g00002 [Zymoseptoria brevis]|uniref:Uncharacterized protein n=1 Tax=Zymoseptoria brevis TaxID=1047168 RepID=A0A0F4GQ03_9PEZI|nr:hypothetical protein TI39_contig356g00002 [Zymoseptoria brevis]